MDPQSIPGWGIDANPQNNPTYPMKHYTGDDHNRLNYEKEPQQPINVELLKSIERPMPSRVFGTAPEPSGLSGIIRRKAFKYSESTYMHWFPLVLADRINVVEGIIDDFRHGHVPNIFAELGWKSEWKHNRKACVRNIIIGAAVIGAFALLLKTSKKDDETEEFSIN